MRKAAKNRRRDVLQKGQLDDTSRPRPLRWRHPPGSEDSWVGFMPFQPPSTFKKLFEASKARAKAKQLPIDLSGEDEYLPSASVSEPSTPPLRCLSPGYAEEGA